MSDVRRRIEERARNTPLNLKSRNLELLIEHFTARPDVEAFYVFHDERTPVPANEYLRGWPGVCGKSEIKCTNGHSKYAYSVIAIQLDGFPMGVSRRAMELRGHLKGSATQSQTGENCDPQAKP